MQMRKTSRPGGEADVRIRENLANTLTRKFVDVMKGKYAYVLCSLTTANHHHLFPCHCHSLAEYQTTQQKFKTEIKKKVKRQVQYGSH